MNMRKSILSKMSGYSSILNSVSPNSDQNLQILRISLKKQMDRKQKLEKLIEKYDTITTQQKNHIKSIKASIIQLKDLQSKCKTKFFLNPIIYVDNHLAKETRQYLCMLLNTFYAKYDENFQCQFKTKVLGKDMNQLLQNISTNQENLLKIQKQTIGVQVQLQGDLLSHKSRLKDEGQRQKQLEDQYKRVSGICSQFEQRYRTQLDKVIKLRGLCKQLQQKISILKDKVAQGQLIKKGKQEMMANQIAYQEKFNVQLHGIDKEINNQQLKEKLLNQKVKDKKRQVQLLKSRYNKVASQVEQMPAPNQHFLHCQTKQNVCPINQNLSQINKHFQIKAHCQSMSVIRKYNNLFSQNNDLIKFSFINSEVNNSNKSMIEGLKSKDMIDHQVKMKIVSMKNEEVLKRKERISAR